MEALQQQQLVVRFRLRITWRNEHVTVSGWQVNVNQLGMADILSIIALLISMGAPVASTA